MSQGYPRIGVVGAGHWGRNLLRNFDRLGALAAFADADLGIRAQASGEYPNAMPFDTLDMMLAKADLDGVIIATPPATHGSLARAALGAGKHVFVEKPLCLDVDEAVALNRLAQESGQTLMVGHLLLYHPAFRAVKQLVDSGEIGKLRYVYSNRLNLGKIRREENALWSFAPHDISMILSLTGEMPKWVSATGGHYLSSDVADTTLSKMEFNGGVQAHIFVSWLHPYKDHRLVVVAEKGMVAFNDTLSGPDKVLLYRHAVGVKNDIPTVSRADAEPVSYADDEPLRLECQTFLDAVAGGALPPSSGEEGIRVLKVLDACQRAIDSGAGVDLTI